MPYKKITQDELNELFKLHKIWLKNHVFGKRLNLKKFDVSGLDFSFKDLRDARLAHAICDGCDFNSSDCSGSDMTWSSFNKCIFIKTDLTHTDFMNSKVKNSIFIFADLTFTEVFGADFTGSNFTDADLDYLKNADGAIFKNVINAIFD